MSSFEVGGVDVGVGLIGGTVAIGAALAVLTPVAAGYGLYKAGEAVKDELVREYREALEKQFKEKAKVRARMEMAKINREKIIVDCEKYIVELQETNTNQTDDIVELVNSLICELSMIQKEESVDLDSLEMLNQRDEQRIADLISRYKKQRELMISISSSNNNVKLFFDSIDKLFESLTFEDYNFVHNIETQTENQVRMQKLYERGSKLIDEFYTIVNREVNRVENCPVEALYVNRIALLFNNMREEIKALQSEDEEWAIESRLDSLRKGIESYYTYKVLLDKEQEKFMGLYLKYKKSCEKTGEEYKETVEFDSYEELEREVSYRVKQLERMNQCAEIYEKLGREAYICLAFEEELNKLNYSAEKKEIAEQLLHRRLQYFKIDDKTTPFYQWNNESLTRIFRINDEVGLQLIVHSDGSCTMETISLSHKESEEVIKTQKEHCKKRIELEEALKKNWFITAELDEEMSAEEISFEFEASNRQEKLNTSKTKSNLQKRAEIAREKQRRKNVQKAQARSMALQY
ncbi:MAG: hypothetical protein ACI4GW_09155 [Lachnospiraceae bacterium]